MWVHSTEASVESEEGEWQVGNTELTEAVFECIFYLLGLLGIVSNLGVLMFMASLKAKQGGRALVLIVNQCLIDVLSSASIIITYGAMFRLKTFGGFLGRLYCRFLWSESLLYLGLQASVFNMVAMSAERLLIIVFPLVHLKSFTRPRAVLIAVGMWVLGILVNIPNTLMSTFAEDDECDYGLLGNSVRATNIYGMFDVVYSYLLPLSFIAYSYSHMIVVLRRRTSLQSSIQSSILSLSEAVSAGESRAQCSPTPSVIPHKKLSKAEHNLFQMMAMLTVCFLICWTPTQTYFMAYAFGAPLSFADPLYYASLTMALLNSTFNPCIYVSVNQNYHKRFKVWLRCRGGF